MLAPLLIAAAVAANTPDPAEIANALSIQGTPAMVIGQELIPGAVGPAELKRAIAAARSGKS